MTAPPHHPFADISPTTLADFVDRGQVMGSQIRPLWSGAPRVAGPAHVVQCSSGDNLMLHAAIYRAAPGSVIVVDAGGADDALAGGNVCAVAQRRGIAGFVLDGVIRDLSEVREMGFPVHARGVVPKPGTKTRAVAVDHVTVGGVTVNQGDIVLADEEGVVVAPAAEADDLLAKARAKEANEAMQNLDEWEAAHRERIDQALRAAGDNDGLPT